MKKRDTQEKRDVKKKDNIQNTELMRIYSIAQGTLLNVLW